ncbi:MAG: siderophore-interacting protein [Propionibacteriaceae bacterium]|nr:siderophore-interacting protein [Propionibacteriaceae bacterium]
MRTDVNLIHRVEVTAVSRLTPGMIRIEFGGEGLDGFVFSGVGDEYLRLFLPPTGHDEPNLPEPAADDYWRFPEGVEPAVARTYTVRAWEPGRLTIDFVVHDGGIAATWALGARPGHIAGVNTPRPLYAAPDDITWQLLVADATGLPAALRLAEQAPDHVQTRVVLEVLAPEHRQDVVPRSNVEVLWTYGGTVTALAKSKRSSAVPNCRGAKATCGWLGNQEHARSPQIPAPRPASALLRFQSRGLLDEGRGEVGRALRGLARGRARAARDDVGR